MLGDDEGVCYKSGMLWGVVWLSEGRFSCIHAPLTLAIPGERNPLTIILHPTPFLTGSVISL